VTLAAAALLLAAACNNAGSSPTPTAASSPTPTPVESSAPTAPSPSSPGGGSPGAGSPSVGASSGGGSGANALQNAFESVVRDVGPSVVVIQTSEGLGSGVAFDGQGDIVTNAHVAGTSNSFRILTASGEQLDGSLVGTFASDDPAVIRTSGGKLEPATFGDSTKLSVGQIVLAIGNPLGLQSSVTEGIISALGRTVTEPGGAAIPNVIPTSAPINPGNSGGALVDLAGQVVGIPTLTATDPQLGGAAPGIGFAIPSSTASDIARQLVEHGRVVSSHRAYLGIQVANVVGANGVLVFSVESGGPADKARLPSGVLITSLAGKPTPDQATLAAVLAQLAPGDAVEVKFERRDGSSGSVKVTLGELPG
jgi:S1-C subfamily serine protease